MFDMPKLIEPAPNVDENTRLRLLAAAEEVFAKQGFKNATIREICRRAGANVAGVNYHFGDKERLYAVVCEQGFAEALKRYPVNMGVADDAPVDERFRAFVRSFLYRVLDETGSGLCRIHKLATREMAEPTAVLDQMVEKLVRPLFGRLRELVGELLGPGADERTITLCARSVVGQCLFYRHAQPVVLRLDPTQKFTSDAIDELAAHITRFSLAALDGVRRELEQRGTVPV
jgi:AcrR family transcriptional regulator